LNKLLIGLFIILTISFFVAKIQKTVEEEQYYLAKIVGKDDVSTIMLAKSNRSINLEEASGHFIENFVASCDECEIVENGYVADVPDYLKGTFDKTNHALSYTLLSAKGIEFVVVEYEGSDNVSLYNCKKRKSTMPTNFPLKMSCVGS